MSENNVLSHIRMIEIMKFFLLSIDYIYAKSDTGFLSVLPGTYSLGTSHPRAAFDIAD